MEVSIEEGTVQERFYVPTENGYEKKIKAHLKHLREREEQKRKKKVKKKEEREEK